MKKKQPNNSSAVIEKTADGRYKIAGDLSFETVPGLWRNSKPLFGGQGSLALDLSQVARSDSAGLALLLEWMRMANETGQSIVFHHIPAQLIDIAKVSGIAAQLPTTS